MSGNIENLNKQIASFIIFGAVLTSPVVASENTLIADASLNMNAPMQRHEIIAMYAAPQIPIRDIKPIPTPQPEPFPAISMYAAPQKPIIEPIHEEIINPPMLRYAAPQFMIPEKSIQPKAEPAINESSLNINKTQLPNNLTKAGINTNVNKINNTNQGFVITDYGNVRVLEPYTHIIFK